MIFPFSDILNFIEKNTAQKDSVEMMAALFIVFGALAVAAQESGAAAVTQPAVTSPVPDQESNAVLADTDKESGAAVVETDNESGDALAVRDKVKVDIISSKPNNPKIIQHYEYTAHITLSIEKEDGTLIPSGWSTRKVLTFSHSAPLAFTWRNIL